MKDTSTYTGKMDDARLGQARLKSCLLDVRIGKITPPSREEDILAAKSGFESVFVIAQ